MKLVNLVSAAVLLVAMGCSSQQTTDPPLQASASANSTSVSPSPTVASQFDARWMGVIPNQPQGWEELGRTINADFQEFNFKPLGEVEVPRCNGCAPWTAALIAYAPGKFEPTQARSGQPVSVIGDNDGFYHPANETEDAMLYWQYADNAWAAIRGRTTMTGELDNMRVLAGALRAGERTPVRLPLTLTTLPADMPLAEIDSDDLGYGTRVKFSECGPPGFSYGEGCKVDADYLGVQIWPKGDYFGTIQGDQSVPVQVGGKDGLYDERIHEAAVRVAPKMIVKFQLDRPGAAKPIANLKEILANVTWAPDPGNEATWPAVTDWAK